MRQDSETRREHLGTAWTARVHGVKTLTWVREGLSRPDETYGRSVSEGVKKSGHGRNILTNSDFGVHCRGSIPEVHGQHDPFMAASEPHDGG
jgi:hypothetical protein